MRFFTILTSLRIGLSLNLLSLVLGGPWALALPLSLSDLHTGDVILQPLSCHLCTLIEEEENSPFSHVGIVLKNEKLFILEAWGSVKKTPLEEFMHRSKKDSALLVLRPQSSLDTVKVENLFTTYFEGLEYDHDFLWDNVSLDGKEKLYCSEFVVKFLKLFLGDFISTRPMHFQKNRDAWIRYFKRLPPDGLPGISPAHLEQSPALIHLGEIITSH